MLKAVKNYHYNKKQRKNTATSGYKSFKGVCVWCVYACILWVNDGDFLGCNFLCYGWGGSGARGSTQRIGLWGGRWIGGLGLSEGKRV